MRLTTHPVLAFALALVANALWDYFLVLFWSTPSAEARDIYAMCSLFFLLPFIAHLVVLYRGAVLLGWPRMLRALALGAASIAAVWVAAGIAVLLSVGTELLLSCYPDAPTPRPNYDAPGNGAVAGLVYAISAWHAVPEPRCWV